MFSQTHLSPAELGSTSRDNGYRPAFYGRDVERSPDSEDYYTDLVHSVRYDEAYEKAHDYYARTAHRGYAILQQAWTTFNQLSTARKKAEKAFEYYDANIWQNKLTVDGQEMTEEQFIRSQNRIPWKLSQIETRIRSLLGQYRQNRSARDIYPKYAPDKGGIDPETSEMLTQKFRDDQEYSRTSEVDTDQFRDFLITGLFVQKVWTNWDDSFERYIPRVENIDLNRFFFNADLKDQYLFDDLQIIGEFRDHPIELIIDRFGGGSRARRDVLIEHFQTNMHMGGYDVTAFTWGEMQHDETFLRPLDQNRARVFEVWRPEWRDVYFAVDLHFGSRYQTIETPDTVEAFNFQRMTRGMAPIVLEKKAFRKTWIGYYLTADGWILREMMSPYRHEQHPYLIGFTELVRGRWKGLVDRLVDVDRFRNRVISAVDFMLGVGAKGVLVVSKDQIPKEVGVKNFAKQWREFGGLVIYEPLPGVQPPKQVTTNSVPAAAFQLLAFLGQESQEISGISNALQGQQPQSGTPNALYQAQIQQSSVNNLNYFHRFFHLIRERDRKMLQLTIQACERVEYMQTKHGHVIQTDPARMRDIIWDVALPEVADSAAVRLQQDDLLFQLAANQWISFEELMQVSGNPVFAKLQALRRRMGMQDLQMDPGTMGQLANISNGALPTPSVDGAVQALQQLSGQGGFARAA